MPLLVADPLLEHKKAAASDDCSTFVHQYILSTSPFAFRNSSRDYSAFRLEISQLLGVHSADICLVGSGQLGFSLNPNHLLREFRTESDLDLVVVSSEIFDTTWRQLVSAQGSFTEESERRRLTKTQESFFKGFLRHDKLPLSTPLARDWFPKLAGPFNTEVAKRHEVKAFLFKSWWHVVGHYSIGVAQVQPKLREILKLT